MNNPLVSVIIPVYNSGQYLEETIRSVLNQTYRNFEIILIDDGSTDNSTQIITRFSSEYSNIKALLSPGAGRPAVPRNIGINNASGELVAFLDSDDLWTKNKLSLQVSYLTANPGVPMIYTASKTFGAVNIFSPFYEVLPLPYKAVTTQSGLINIGNTITCSSVLARKEFIIREGGFDEDPQMRVEDYDLWIRLANYGSIGFLPVLSVYYRVHHSQFSGDWETKSARVRYLAQKRNLPIPDYKMIRNKGIVLLLIRNIIHFFASLYYKLMGLSL